MRAPRGRMRRRGRRRVHAKRRRRHGGPVPWRTAGARSRRTRRAAARAPARRRAVLARLADARTVRAALRRALLTGAITPRAYDRTSRRWPAPAWPRGGSGGARGVEERPSSRRSTSSRRGTADAEPVRRRLPQPAPQHAHVDPAAFPLAGERRTFGDDPAVFQYIPGRGMQLHPLATWGKMNARLRRCLSARGGLRRARRCGAGSTRSRGSPPRAAASSRGSTTTRYAQGAPPWISGMAQATAVQALSRAARAFRAPRYARLARRALGAFETPPPAGVAVPAAAGGERYVMYSFAPTMQILNGELQAVNGLRDAAVLGRSARAARLVRAGDTAVRARRRRASTRAPGRSTRPPARDDALLPPAHDRLPRRARAGGPARAAYCGAAAPLHALRARAAADRDRAAARAAGAARGAAAVLALEGLGGGGARLRPARARARARPGARARRPRPSFTPPSRGRFRVRVSARGPEGRLGVAAAGACRSRAAEARAAQSSPRTTERARRATPPRAAARRQDRAAARSPAPGSAAERRRLRRRPPPLPLPFPLRPARGASTPSPWSSPSSAANLATSRAWSSSTNVMPTPLAPARAVRPMRWT